MAKYLVEALVEFPLYVHVEADSAEEAAAHGEENLSEAARDRVDGASFTLSIIDVIQEE